MSNNNLYDVFTEERELQKENPNYKGSPFSIDDTDVFGEPAYIGTGEFVDEVMKKWFFVFTDPIFFGDIVGQKDYVRIILFHVFDNLMINIEIAIRIETFFLLT